MRRTLVCSGIAIATLLAVPAALAAEACGKKYMQLTCTTKKCPVVVFQDKDKNWQVFPYRLKITQKPAKIIFIMRDGSRFITDPSKKHGVEPKLNGSGQFSEGYATDEFNDTPAKKETGPHWHVRFENDGNGKDDIEYELTFEDSGEEDHVRPDDQ